MVGFLNSIGMIGCRWTVAFEEKLWFPVAFCLTIRSASVSYLSLGWPTFNLAWTWINQVFSGLRKMETCSGSLLLIYLLLFS